MANVRVLATGLEFPEGPVVMPDGSVVLVEIRGRRLTRVFPDGRKETVAEIPGGPNGAAFVRRSRVVLTPRRWRHVGDDASHHADNGGKRARSPGRARRKP